MLFIISKLLGYYNVACRDFHPAFCKTPCAGTEGYAGEVKLGKPAVTRLFRHIQEHPLYLHGSAILQQPLNKGGSKRDEHFHKIIHIHQVITNR